MIGTWLGDGGDKEGKRDGDEQWFKDVGRGIEARLLGREEREAVRRQMLVVQFFLLFSLFGSICCFDAFYG